MVAEFGVQRKGLLPDSACAEIIRWFEKAASGRRGAEIYEKPIPMDDLRTPFVSNAAVSGRAQ